MPLNSFPTNWLYGGWTIRRLTQDVAEFHRKVGAKPKYAPVAQALRELEIRRSSLQAQLRYSLGLDPWPERTALNSRLAGELERPGYRIEKLVYEAWAGLPVSAHLYIPDPWNIPAQVWYTPVGIGWKRGN